MNLIILGAICGKTGCLKCNNNSYKVQYLKRWHCASTCEDSGFLDIYVLSFNDSHPDIPSGTSSFFQNYCYPRINDLLQLYLSSSMSITEPFTIDTCQTNSYRHPDGLWCNLNRCPAGTFESAGECIQCFVSGCLKCDTSMHYCDSGSCAPGFYGSNPNTIESQPTNTYQQCIDIGYISSDSSYGPPINSEDTHESTIMTICSETQCEDCSFDSSVCQKCKSNLILSVDKESCLDNCPDGQMEYHSDDINYCIKCKVENCRSLILKLSKLIL